MTWANSKIIEDYAVLIRDGQIEEVGPSKELRQQYADEEQLDASAK